MHPLTDNCNIRLGYGPNGLERTGPGKPRTCSINHSLEMTFMPRLNNGVREKNGMKLSIESMALTSGILWGGSMLACGLMNLASRSYARPFLGMMSSVYPGFHNSRKLSDVLVGAGYGFVDGAVGGAVVAALYNRLAEKTTEPHHELERPLAGRL